MKRSIVFSVMSTLVVAGFGLPSLAMEGSQRDRLTKELTEVQEKIKAITKDLKVPQFEAQKACGREFLQCEERVTSKMYECTQQLSSNPKKAEKCLDELQLMRLDCAKQYLNCLSRIKK